MAEMSLFSSEQLVWIDETGCRNKDCIRAAGYALRGMTPVCTRFLAKGRRVSCIAAIAHDGLVAVETTRDSVDSTNFVRGSLIPNMVPFDGSNPRSVAILDNCLIHHVESVREIFGQAGVLLFYLPAYSPDLNPIELAFSKVKYYLKEHNELVLITPNPIPISTAAFNTITTEDCMNWMTYCAEYFSVCDVHVPTVYTNYSFSRILAFWSSYSSFVIAATSKRACQSLIWVMY